MPIAFRIDIRNPGLTKENDAAPRLVKIVSPESEKEGWFDLLAGERGEGLLAGRIRINPGLEKKRNETGWSIWLDGSYCWLVSEPRACFFSLAGRTRGRLHEIIQ